MSTRKLILAALLCGLAILVAGGIFLVKLAANQDDLTVPDVLSVGGAVDVDGTEAAVLGSEERGDAVVVRVRLRAGSDGVDDAGEGWALVAGAARDRIAVPEAADAACAGVAVAPAATLECTLAFDGSTDATSYVEYARGDDRARWRLNR